MSLLVDEAAFDPGAGRDIGPLEEAAFTLLSPIDLQCVKACGVTFAVSAVERVIEERARGDAAAAAMLRARLEERVGGSIRSVIPGSSEAAELKHALILSRQIDYLGKMPVVTPKPVKTSEDAREMLRFDLDNENDTIRNYRVRVRQCEALGEYAMAEEIRQILVDEQDHQIDLATALGEEVPDLT